MAVWLLKPCIASQRFIRGQLYSTGGEEDVWYLEIDISLNNVCVVFPSVSISSRGHVSCRIVCVESVKFLCLFVWEVVHVKGARRSAQQSGTGQSRARIVNYCLRWWYLDLPGSMFFKEDRRGQYSTTTSLLAPDGKGNCGREEEQWR